MMRILLALAGLHRYNRGAEIAFISVAEQLALGGHEVTLIGSGPPRPNQPYRYIQSASIPREKFERFPTIPLLRTEYAYEELTFALGLVHRFKPSEYDVTLTCGFPFTNWILRRPQLKGRRPPHVFVTQNGDWPAYSKQKEYRFFGCEGLICTNKEYFDRNVSMWNCELISNGVDCEKFSPAPIAGQRPFGMSEQERVVLMVSALIESKRVETGIRAVSKIPDARLIVAGDGPLREDIDKLAAELLPNRFSRLTLHPDKMPDLYRSANVFLHLSKSESFGNIFLEAMASGLPVVGHDSPHLRSILGEVEFLTDTDNVDTVVASLRSALGAPSTNVSNRVANAKSFAWQNIAKQYEAFLSQVVDNRHQQIR